MAAMVYSVLGGQKNWLCIKSTLKFYTEMWNRTSDRSHRVNRFLVVISVLAGVAQAAEADSTTGVSNSNQVKSGTENHVANGKVCTQAQDSGWSAHVHAGGEALANGRYLAAEKLFSSAVMEAEKSGPKDARLAVSLNLLGAAYRSQRKYGEAEQALKRALTIWRENLGPNHYDVAVALTNLASSTMKRVSMQKQSRFINVPCRSPKRG